MATLPVIPDGFRVALNWSNSGGGYAVNVMHFVTLGLDKTATQVWTNLNDKISANLWEYIGTTLSVATVDITPLDGLSATETFATGTPAKWTGKVNGDVIPQMAGVIKLTTPFRGRSARGRLYLPGICESQQNNGTLLNTSVATAQTAWTAFVAAVEADATTPMAMVVASYKNASAAAVTGVTVESKAGTQRRRMTRLR